QHTSVHNVMVVAGLVAVALTGSVATAPAPTSDTLAQRAQAGQVTDAKPAVIALSTAPQAAAASPFKFKPDAYYEQLRRKLHWEPVRIAGTVLETPDVPSRLLLVESAAKRAGLAEVGLSYRDVYGIINAETSWIPRMG